MNSAKSSNRLVGHGRFMMAILACLLLAAGTAVAQSKAGPAGFPKNVSPGLRELMQKGPAPLAAQAAPAVAGALSPAFTGDGLKPIFDKNNRVLVDVHMNGRTGMAEMHNMLEQLGARVSREHSGFNKGVIEAFLPLSSVEQAAQHPGTGSIRLMYRPYANVGATTSQGTTVMRTDVANTLGFDGTGVTVATMSDSYNTSQFAGITTTTALQDVGTGDLPNNTSVPGCEGLKYCVELDPNIFGPEADEGRGMAQIVHDVAPGADLCFATAFSGELEFALNILDLAFNPACAADVITDDVIYFDEPMFSDGIVAQAADIVAANGISYFSSAGNQAFSGYSSELRIISDAKARALPNQAVNLSTLPAVDQFGEVIDTTGGFHNFNSDGGGPVISQLINVSNPIFSFQWDDPYGFVDENGNPLVTTDLDMHFFDPSTGNWLFSFSTDNFTEDFPIELFQISGRGSLELVISRKGTNLFTGQPATNQATHIKYVVFGTIAGDFITPLTPLTYGHNSANGANGVAAYRYNEYPGFNWNVPGTRPGPSRPELEYFSAPGPVLIFFDQNGNRLRRPEFRLKPDMAAPDGVNTTFFPQPEIGGSDYEALYQIPDGFPNFFGTSAAAPHAAGVAALLIQKAGGSGSLSPDSVHNILIHSAPPRDSDIYFSRASAGPGLFGPQVTIEAADPEFLSLFTGQNGGQDANFFTISFWAFNPKVTLQSLTLNLTASGQAFRPSTFPVTQGTSSPGVSITSSSPNTLSQTITLNFSGFTPGKVLRFGVYRVFVKNGVAVGTGGKAGDMMGGDTFTATLSNGQTFTGMFRNRLDDGYRVYDGFGLIDAVNALSAVHGHHH